MSEPILTDDALERLLAYPRLFTLKQIDGEVFLQCDSVLLKYDLLPSDLKRELRGYLTPELYSRNVTEGVRRWIRPSGYAGPTVFQLKKLEAERGDLMCGSLVLNANKQYFLTVMKYRGGRTLVALNDGNTFVRFSEMTPADLRDYLDPHIDRAMNSVDGTVNVTGQIRQYLMDLFNEARETQRAMRDPKCSVCREQLNMVEGYVIIAINGREVPFCNTHWLERLDGQNR